MNAKETTLAKTEVSVQTCEVITPVTAVTLGTEADSVKNLWIGVQMVCAKMAEFAPVNRKGTTVNAARDTLARIANTLKVGRMIHSQHHSIFRCLNNWLMIFLGLLCSPKLSYIIIMVHCNWEVFYMEIMCYDHFLPPHTCKWHTYKQRLLV